MSQINDLYKIFKNECTCLVDEPMSKHTTFKIGGKADIMLFPKNEEQIRKIILECKKQNINWQVVGNGSNLLVKDQGVRGAIIVVGQNMNEVVAENNYLVAQAGASLSSACVLALSNSLSGLEFAWGIPGNVGGAIFMNAGAYGGEIVQVLKKARIVSKDGSRDFYMTADELQLGYRHSVLHETGDVVVEAVLELEPGNVEEIRANIADFTERRNSKQPVTYPSAGSFFKRPEGYFAGKLVQDAGFKGLTVGGAQVSQLHSGFVINIGGATATDILQLMEIVQAGVYEQFGVKLEPEVRIIGEEL